MWYFIKNQNSGLQNDENCRFSVFEIAKLDFTFGKLMKVQIHIYIFLFIFRLRKDYGITTTTLFKTYSNNKFVVEVHGERELHLQLRGVQLQDVCQEAHGIQLRYPHIQLR